MKGWEIYEGSGVKPPGFELQLKSSLELCITSKCKLGQFS